MYFSCCFFLHFELDAAFCLKGTLFNWTLILHGTTNNPLDGNPHVPTPVTPDAAGKTSNAKTPPPPQPTKTSKIVIYLFVFLDNLVTKLILMIIMQLHLGIFEGHLQFISVSISTFLHY